MKRWIGTVCAALLIGLTAAAPAGACACGGEPYSPWRDRLGVVAPIVVAVAAGSLAYRAFRRKAAK